MKKLLLTFPILVLLAASCNSNQQSAVLTQAPSVQNTNPTPTQAPVTQSDWTTYQNASLGFSIDYPNDGTYQVATSQGNLSIKSTPVNGYGVSIMQPASLFTIDTMANQHVYMINISADPNILTSLPDSLEPSSTTTIDGILFQKLTVNPAVALSHPSFNNVYAYAIQHGGQYYVFQSHNGPDDPIFEHMMTTLKFNQ